MSEKFIAEEDLAKPHKCPYCNRRFTAYTNMRRHVRERCKIAPNEKNGDMGMERLYTHVLQQQIQIQEQQRQITELTNRMGSEKSGPQAATGGVAIQGDHAQVNQIILNIHGKEDPKAITTEQIKEAIEAGGGTNEILGRVMRALYHDIPENRNAWLSNKKDNLAMVYEGATEQTAKWVPKDRKEILPGMVAKSAVRFLDADYELLDVLPEGTPARNKKDSTVRELINDSFKSDIPTDKLLKGLDPTQRAILIANRPPG